MACNWLPHNLNEVANAIYAVLDGQEPTLPGPDFPTGGIIINKNDIPGIMKTGHGSVKVRAKYKVEKNCLIFYEIPYGQTIEGLLEEIKEVCDKKEIEDIADIRDESNKKGLRIVVECKKNVSPDVIAQKLFNKTNLQTSISYNQVALVNKIPTELNLKQCIDIYLKHNEKCIIREAMFDIKKTQDKLHIIVGLIKALDIIDDIIAMIKSSPSAAAAKETLQTKWGFSEAQAKAILDMKLSRLAKLEKEELEQEKKELEELLIKLYEIVQHPEVELRKRLEAIVKKYGDARRTDLAQIEIKPEEKEIAEVVPVDVIVVATQSGLIKKVPVASFKVQKRGGKGVKSEDDVILDMIKTNTIDTMMFFTTKGKMYRCLVDSIPDGTSTGRGVPINTLIKMDASEKVIAVTSLHRKTTPQFIFFITKNGMIKKSYLEEYTKTNRNTGIAALNVKEGDEVVDILFQDTEDLVLVTKNGMGIRFTTKDIGAIGRVAMGVKGIKLAEGDEVVAAMSVHKESDTVALFSSNGLGKKIALTELTVQGRGGKGLILYKAADQSTIVGAKMVSDEDLILISGNKTSICFSAAEIPLLGRTSAGNIMIKDNKVISVTKI